MYPSRKPQTVLGRHQLSLGHGQAHMDTTAENRERSAKWNLATHTPHVVASGPLGLDFLKHCTCQIHETLAAFEEEAADCEAPKKLCDTLH